MSYGFHTKGSAPASRKTRGPLTDAEIVARAKRFDAAAARHKARKRREEAKATEWQPWETDRSLLPKKPPGGHP